MKEDLLATEMKVLPALDSLYKEMANFKKEREEHMDILIRYDEVITDKASKYMLGDLREEVHRKFAR